MAFGFSNGYLKAVAEEKGRETLRSLKAHDAGRQARIACNIHYTPRSCESVECFDGSLMERVMQACET